MRCLLIGLVVGCGFHGSSRELPDAKASDGPNTVFDGAAPPIVFRQVNSAEGISQATATIGFIDPQTAGDLDVVMVGWFKSGTLVSVSDSSNNAYAIAVGPTMTGMESQVIYYACNIAAAGAGANTVTVTFENASQDPDVRIAEYSGLQATGCFDRAAASTGTATTIDSGPLVTTHGHELLVGANKVFNLTSTGDPGYTTRKITGFGDLVEDLEVTTAGTYHATSTENTAGAWVMQLVAFEGQ